MSPNVIIGWFALNEADNCLCSIVIAELAFGTACLPEGRKQRKLSDALSLVRERFSYRTYPFSVASALIYADVMLRAREAGLAISISDAQIAAVARENGIKLATRNIGDFATTGLVLTRPCAIW